MAIADDTRIVLGTCHHDCPDSCGWVATAVGDTLVSVKGNPDHPFSRGELCPKVNRFVDRVNHAERLLTPLIRVGAKGAGEFRKATWDEALTLTANRLRNVAAEHGGDSIVPWNSAGTQGLIQHSATAPALFARLGARKQVGNVCGAASGVAMASVYGASLGTDPLQAEHSDQIILWGTNTRLTNRHYWPVVEAAQKRGARVVVVDPIRTITADRADAFIQPLPGTDVALLLAICHVLIAEDLIDRSYIDDHTSGFEEFARHVDEHSPEWAAPLCGLDVSTIVDLARSIGSTQKTMLRALIGVEHHHSGPTMYRLLSMIPLLTGSHRVLGGGFARSVGAWSEISDVDIEAVARIAAGFVPDGHERAVFEQPRLGRTLTDPDENVRALLVWNGNPVLTMPESGLIRDGLQREDLFTVVSEQFMTDTARYADVIFPAAMETEQLDVMPSWGHLWIGWNEPATPPLGEAVSNSEFFRRLAGALGFEDEVFSMTDQELIALMVGGHVDLDAMRRDGFVRVTEHPVDHLPYAAGGFATPTGRAEFVADSYDSVGVPRLPSWIPVEEGAGSGDAYPLSLQTPKKATRFLNTSYSELEGHAGRETRPHVELDPADASIRGLADGDKARVFNHRGSLVLPVAISDRLRPGVASVPWGYVDAAYGDGVGSVNDLTNAGDTVFGSGSSYGDTLVDVQPI